MGFDMADRIVPDALGTMNIRDSCWSPGKRLRHGLEVKAQTCQEPSLREAPVPLADSVAYVASSPSNSNSTCETPSSHCPLLCPEGRPSDGRRSPRWKVALN